MGIDALIGRMESLLDPLEESGDRRRFFHATYLRTTRAVRDALRDGLFADPDWVQRWDVAFADLCLRACTPRPGTPGSAAPWEVAFRAARDTRTCHRSGTSCWALTHTSTSTCRRRCSR